MRENRKQIGGQVSPEFDSELREAATQNGFASKWGFILWVLTQYLKGNFTLKQ